MANLPESATYDAGVYQIETTDAVVGGAGGKSNAAAINLANRTTWLKAQVDALLAAGLAESGAVAYFAKASAPTGWLKANGAAVSRTTYAALFAAIGTAFGVGDGSTTFNLPDLRGEFLRAWDDGRGVDAARAFGSAQSAYAGYLTISTGLYNVANGAFSVLEQITLNGHTWGDNTAAGDVPVTPGDARPRNMALLACIKY